MRKLTILGSAIAIFVGWQVAQAQPPGGGGGRGGMANVTFDAINKADENGKKDNHLTVEEVSAYFAEMMAARGGGPGGPPGGGGAGGQDMGAQIFARWDTVPEGGDGMITEEEFNNRPQGGGRGGRGGPPPQ